MPWLAPTSAAPRRTRHPHQAAGLAHYRGQRVVSPPMTEAKNVEDAVAVLVARGPVCERCVASHVGIPATADLTRPPVRGQIALAHGTCRACKRRGVIVLSFSRVG